MGENVHDIEQPPVDERKLWATLHSWEVGVPGPFPTEQNQVGEQLETRPGASVSFPVAEADGLRFIALWHGGALLWRSEVFLCPTGKSPGLTLNFTLPPEGGEFNERVVDPRCSASEAR